MAERSRFFSRRSGDAPGDYTYSAEDFAEYLATFFATGVVGNNLQVTVANSAVTLSKGCATVCGHWYTNDSTLTLGNPITPLSRRYDTIVLRLDKDARKITATWLVGTSTAYPKLQTGNIYDLPLANLEIMSGGVINNCTDRRIYSNALYSMSYDSINDEWASFLESCKLIYNQQCNQATGNAEIIKARGGQAVLSARHDITDTKLDQIITAGTANLFDVSTAQIGMLDYGEVDPNIKSYYTSDYIPFDYGTTLYFFTGTGVPVKFSWLEIYSSRSSDGLIHSYYNDLCDVKITNKVMAKWMRVSFDSKLVDKGQLQITANSVPPTKYIPYKLVIKSDAVAAVSQMVHDFGMCYVTSSIAQSINDPGCNISVEDIAAGSPVNLKITGGPGGTKFVRTDGKPLYYYGTTNVVTSVSPTVVAAEDLVAGIKLDLGGKYTIKYYSSPCKDLIDYVMASSGGTGGRGIVSCDIDTSNHLIITYSDGTKQDCGAIKTTADISVTYNAEDEQLTIDGSTVSYDADSEQIMIGG